MEKMNAGFTIIAMEMTREHEGIVLGVRPNRFGEDGKEWVTWMYTDHDGPSYFWGHYFFNEENARKDYHDRLAREYERTV